MGHVLFRQALENKRSGKGLLQPDKASEHFEQPFLGFQYSFQRYGHCVLIA